MEAYKPPDLYRMPVYAPASSKFDLGDRHIAVALFLGAWLIAVPLIVCLGLLFATAWLNVIGGFPNVHATLWGWLSSHVLRHDSKGNPYYVWGIAGWVGAYFIMVASAYLVYWFGEGVWAAFRTFKRALSA